MLPRLLDKHGGKLYSLAVRMCANESDAQDLLQEVFLQAHRKWHTFRGESDPATWLYAIAARKCRRELHRTRRPGRRMPALSQVAPWTEATNSEAGLRLDTPFRALEKKEATEALHAAIVKLPATFRVPLILKEILELPIAEVAAALGVKPETVKTRVHRARLLLRKAIVSSLPRREAPQPVYEKSVCMDLLRAKLDAMDAGRNFPVGQDVICSRCRAVFRELDLVQDTCSHLAEGRMPPGLRSALIRDAQRPE